ncbi:MAG: phage antirepressor N-terminal domain-containing protein [Bacteroidota bacterium]
MNFNRQYQNIKKDEILSGAFAVQQMRGAETPMKNFACLPEKYIYGWLFSIRSNVAALQEYKKKCYDVLYNYFNGSIIRRNELLKKKAKVLTEMRSLEEELKDNQKYQELNRLKGQMLNISNLLKKIDDQQANRQLTLFNN